MAKGDWFIKLEINGWMNNLKVRKLSRANRDSWLSALFLMKMDGVDRLTGTPEEMANMLSLTVPEFEDFVADLKRSKAADVTDVTLRNKNVTILSRRLRRELKAKEQTRLRVEKHRSNAHVTPVKQTPLNSNKKEVISNKEKEDSAERETAPANTTPKKSKKPSDPRKDHPAIKAVLNAMSRYPLKDLWDKIIREIGEKPDEVFIQCCYETWRGVNGNPMNLEKWLFEPHKTGMIPEVFGGKINSSANGQRNTKPTNSEIAAEFEREHERLFGRE